MKYIFSNSTTACVPYVKPVIHCTPFFSEGKRQIEIEPTRFLSTACLCNTFKLGNIYYAVNFCGKYVCGNFYLLELIFADRWKNHKN